ncbi:hypothetical protein EB008_04945 [bacterium]|nr:hypothetical protein [bacterium]
MCSPLKKFDSKSLILNECKEHILEIPKKFLFLNRSCNHTIILEEIKHKKSLIRCGNKALGEIRR